MPPIACRDCGDTNGPFVRRPGHHLCEDCADKQKDGKK